MAPGLRFCKRLPTVRRNAQRESRSSIDVPWQVNTEKFSCCDVKFFSRSFSRDLFGFFRQVVATEHGSCRISMSCVSSQHNSYFLTRYVYFSFWLLIQSGIFPPANLVSPVADGVRRILADFRWAKAGLGLPLVRLHGYIITLIK